MYKPKEPKTRKVICPQCKGRGTIFYKDVFNWGPKPCPACNGTGWIEIPIIPRRW